MSLNRFLHIFGFHCLHCLCVSWVANRTQHYFPSLCHQQIPDDIIRKWNICCCLTGKLRNAQNHQWSLLLYKAIQRPVLMKVREFPWRPDSVVIQCMPRQPQASRPQSPDPKLLLFNGVIEGWQLKQGYLNWRHLPWWEKGGNLYSVNNQSKSHSP